MEKEEIIAKQKRYKDYLILKEEFKSNDPSFIKSKYYAGDIVKYLNKSNVPSEDTIEKVERRKYDDRWLDSSHGCYRTSIEERTEYYINGDWYQISNIISSI